VRRAVLGDSPLKFAAHVPFYGPCGYFYSNDGGRVTTGAPMLKLYAGKDETTPRAKCERIDELIRAADPAAKIEIVWYPDAYHAWEMQRAPRFYPHHVNAAKYPIIDFGTQIRFIELDGRARPFVPAEMPTCIRESTGYSMGYSEEAARESPKAMLAFFARHLRDE
jgi:dienelactone hydrolase